MGLISDVEIGAVSLDRFVPVLGPERVATTLGIAASVREKLHGGAVWNVNSTAVGGGVAEMLPPLLAYARGMQIDARWVVIHGEHDFFVLTKRVHHALHGSVGEGGPPHEVDRALYEATCTANASELALRLGPGDVVILHDPQTAGMAPHLIDRGARVIWRCHIGADVRTPEVDQGWAFLRPYLERVPVLVFSRREYVPRDLDGPRVRIIQPSIDAFSPKNEDMDVDVVRAILAHVGVLSGPCPDRASPVYTRRDGSPARVERVADIVRAGPAPDVDVPLVVQVSRWDPLKDMHGVMCGFAKLIASGRAGDSALVLAGPNVHAVADDPEGPRVYHDVLDGWYKLPPSARARITLAMLPTADVDENAAIVNALQRHGEIVVQKSLHEGFGLTVTEAMWKSRTVIATRTGGIQDQIVQGESGIMIDDALDLDAFANALAGLVSDPDRRRRMGAAARARATEHFLGIRHLLDYAAVIDEMLSATAAPARTVDQSAGAIA
ncbi:glycosyltransferase [Sandaracinus amylolyticus]|uniref:Trehalose synthase n=1 Tax=Sandaracinus amylolyticus TaxID=927083 RepID=A0A0F6SEW4_9BACT|nr:glycosyltransferase [Sandaracinus amylolyticus]AKF05899.1 Trehalose synthase [Sandaracinus amylolyticus]